MSECPNIARDLADERYDQVIRRDDGYVYFMRTEPHLPPLPVQYCRVMGRVVLPHDCARELFWSRCPFRWRSIVEARD